jgi:uncharacterized damage-inducible protein DinB
LYRIANPVDREVDMSLVAVTFEDLLADYQLTTAKWKKFFAANPAAAEVATDIAGSGTIGGLVSHIYMAAVRSSERLLGEPISDFKGAERNLAGAWELEPRATANLRRFLDTANDAALDEILRFQTKAAGEVAVSRRKLCLHIFVHTIRHWAQIGTIVRQQGYPPDWGQDILFSAAIR